MGLRRGLLDDRLLAMATMAGKRDYYEVLGVERGASEDAIKTAYRKLAKENHPDRRPGDGEAIGRFKEASEAFEVLGNSDKRARYDRYGHAGLQGDGGVEFEFGSDIFEAVGDLFFGGGGGGKRRRRARKGGDVRCDIGLDLLEAARGATKVARYQIEEICSDCGGSGARAGAKPEPCRYCGGRGQVVQEAGFIRMQTTCPSCRGAGSTIREKCGRCGGPGITHKRVEREVSIPAGVDSEMAVPFAGAGNPSREGGPPGDLYCVITVREHPLFQREGLHLICNIPITFSQAALGAELSVPTLDGREELRIPPGTQPGDVFKLRGRGMPDPRQRGVGDLLVQVALEVPRSLTPHQEKLLRELAEEERSNVSPHRKSFFGKLKDYFSPGDEGERDDES